MEKTQYVDTEKLNDYIKKSGLRVGFLSDQLGITNQAFYQKRTGLVSFRKSEVHLLMHLMNMSEDDAAKIFCLKSTSNDAQMDRG